MPDQQSDRISKRERYLKRRRFLHAAGAVGGASLLAGCGGSEADTQPTGTAGSPTASTTATETETPEAETETPEETGPSLEERYPGLRILSPEPENAEAAERATYTTLVTPLEELYIRNHYPTPEIDEADWSVSLTGLVDEEVDLSMEELKNGFPTETVFHVMQCSGNGRSYFQPQVGGNQWTFGAVGNAEWTGTPLSAVLERYGADTSDGMWLSAMGGEAPEGEDVFTRSIPMSKVMDDCLLAYEMNGRPLASDHGFPVRLVVPGWYGNNNVKWVNRMHVMDMMVFGEEWEDGDQRTYTHWQQYSYRIIPEQDEAAEQYESVDVYDTYEQMQNPDEIRNAYIFDQLVKSQIGHPGEDSTVTRQPDGSVEVVGVAWAGDQTVDSVEVSDDGGETWGEAEFFRPDLGVFSWRLFRYVWSPEPGEYRLVSRATDSQGRTQPATISSPEEGLRGIQDDMFPWNQDGYIATAYEPHGVNVTVEE
ncbi:molybdopterin-dependent oxidoreductase [Halorarum salinum]|uniref:Molybdopterin-dependent oxidoreductase n=1 Tax=Halorarum salinum TaxID=2743089 RepID=A0A7D5LAW8_9EURY|nr:molybdopterin-dependent oxidoreductase [Halobaculum salinum]QLG62506.1 molybdopterin-dependent oxidoreductase [Halobaculum salinum]